MIVDSHCHASSRWYEPVDTLLFNMDRCGVDRAILVQLLGSTDNGDMIAACRVHPDRFAFIGAIDPDATESVDAVGRAVDDGACGLRMRAGWRRGGGDPLALWRVVERSGLRVSLVGTADSFTDRRLAEIAEACPNLPILLEHMAGLARPDAGDRAAMQPAVCALARYPNLHVKIGGLGQVAPRRVDVHDEDGPLDLADLSALFAPLIAAFGPDRLLWGSDFPPVAAREGYANALDWTRRFIGEHWPDAIASCFGDTARRIFTF